MDISIRGNNNIIKIELPFNASNSRIDVPDNNNAYIELRKCPAFHNVYIRCRGCGEQYFFMDKECIIWGAQFILDGNSHISIGKDCLFSDDIFVWADDGHTVLDAVTGEILNKLSGTLSIGDHCWIGQGVRITKNARIGNNCIIGGGAVAVKDYDEDNVIIAGNPAKIIKRGITWDHQNIYQLEQMRPQKEDSRHKKDVALVGLWGNVNYGSVLTNFSAYHFIKDCGKSVILIERPKNSIEKPYVGNIFHKIPYPKNDLSRKYAILNEMEELNKVSDTFIVNSDILYGEYSVRVFNQFMLLDYIHNDKNKYAYAGSFGFDKFTGDETLRKKIATSLQSFKKFTVREKSGIDVAKNYFNISAEWVVDPLFLCNVKHFKKFSQKGKALLAKGICCYILDTTEHDGLRIADDVEAALNLKKCVISDYQNPANRVNNITVEDWLATYLASDFIITDSFHGTCMAIILKKPFITIGNVRRGLTRFESILDLAGLKNHLVLNFEEYQKKKEELLTRKMDWKKVQLNMKEKIKRSSEIFKEMIGNK